MSFFTDRVAGVVSIFNEEATNQIPDIEYSFHGLKDAGQPDVKAVIDERVGQQTQRLHVEEEDLADSVKSVRKAFEKVKEGQTLSDPQLQDKVLKGLTEGFEAVRQDKIDHNFEPKTDFEVAAPVAELKM